MFERYTEKARRTIFFARYEASQYGSSTIASEHLLLGLLREDRTICTAWRLYPLWPHFNCAHFPSPRGRTCHHADQFPALPLCPHPSS
jgi:hypothetical protein